MTQLVIWDVLEVRPTPAMLDGRQTVTQCASCGTVVVSPDGRTPDGCPCCHHETEKGSAWWAQTLPVAGIHRRDDG